MQACDRCYRRKSKCDKSIPACSQCLRARATCHYVDRTREPTVRREVFDRVERRLRQAEAKNRALSSQLMAYQSSRSDEARHEEDQDSQRPSQISEASFPFDRTEVADEVSFLSRQAGGDGQYLGVASGVVFANLVQGIASLNPPAQHGQFPHRVSLRSGTQPNSSLSLAQETLPPERVARHLHHAYLNHDHLCFPFLNRRSVLANLDRIYADGSVLETDAGSAFIFYMIQAIAMASAHKCEWQSLPESENFQARAMARVNEVLQCTNIRALQAVLLLCQYRMTSSAEETSASLWHMVGIAARMCFEMGLHRNQTYHTPTTSHSSPELLAESETRRRCFWSVLDMDRVVSITLGRPLAIHLEDVDTALPDPDLDESNELDGDKPHGVPSPIAIFNHITRYRILSGKVMVSLHGNRGQSHDEISIGDRRSTLFRELENWRSETKDLRLIADTQKTRQSSFLSPEWYELLYYNTLLMLYRPSPALSNVQIRTPLALQPIFDASKEAISRYAMLHTSQRINYTWITLHAVFMAGLSYIYAVSGHFRARRVNNSSSYSTTTLTADPSILEVVNTCRSCSIVLVAVSERWATPRHCHKVFDRLGDAVLADVISFFTKPQQTDSLALSGQQQKTLHDTTRRNALLHLVSGVDLALRDCFDDLQHFHDAHGGDGPIQQLSQDWLDEIGGMALDARKKHPI
ncbi:hypothetical protein N7450_003804 [Penicillium hetheringtonii]|uniref:Zn(2)-C6 fungal-type domain-containing protein n=1 Tax=Penicillium hetheringtonii TaxID=911720 RepID=A0AAD6GUI3_9EURO|nr:hypothetical protein N7450_003804 [Penicillium hetheringtonii]